MATPEGKVKGLIKKYLDSLGGDLWPYMPVPSLYGTRAVDYLLCYKGFFFCIEAKAEGMVPSKAQDNVMRKVERAGGTAFWVDGPKRLELVKEWIELVDNESPLKSN